jgi:hypothetical protein
MATSILRGRCVGSPAPRRSIYSTCVAIAMTGFAQAAGACTFTWESGSYLAAGMPSPLAAGSSVCATGTGVKNFESLTLNINGELLWETDARLGLANATLNNAGLIDLRANVGDPSIQRIAGSGANSSQLVNSGTLRKSGGTGTSVVSYGTAFMFSNSGTIDVRSGTIDFGANAGTNEFNAVFNAGSRFTGDGTSRVSASATFNGSFTSSNLVLAAGGFTGNNAVLNGSVAWTGGSLVGSWQVAAGQSLIAGGTDIKNFSTGNVTIAGTLTWGSTASRMGLATTTVTNSGLVDFQGDADLAHAGGSASTFINQGTLRKSGGTEKTEIGANINFSNPGTIEALSGTIALPANFTNIGTIKGTATVQTNTLTNTGTIAPGASPGVLTLSGSLVMTNSSILEIEFESLSSFDTLAVTGAALLDGTLSLRKFGDYAPRVGDSFKVMTYSARVGQSMFDMVDSAAFGSGVQFSVAYNVGDVTLSVTAVPEPETYALMVAGLGVVAWAARRRRTRA